MFHLHNVSLPISMLYLTLLAGEVSMALLKTSEMTVQRLDIGEDTHGIWLVTHHHHVFHFYQTVTVSHFPVLTIKQI